MQKLNRFFVMLILLFSATLSTSIAQTTITIGNGTSNNLFFEFPAPYGNWAWGAKHQFLIKASELTAQGMISGNITSLAFNVAATAGTPLNSFTIKLKLTNATSITSSFDNNGLTTVFGPQTYTETQNWNTHTFISPFFWDGTSNILVETCFDNTNFTSNASVYNSTTSFNSTVYSIQYFSGVCSNTFGTVSTVRPNIRFVYIPSNIPPIADFYANTTFTCSGFVEFHDISQNLPTSWFWNFGDGNTSTLRNPTHTYSTNGTYTVSLKATNTFGNDTKMLTNYITVNTSTPPPVSASCTPHTVDGSQGFGITNFTFNTINNTSADASEGFGDYTCNQTNVYVAQNYSISAITNTPAEHNVRAWIDYNNDGAFNNNTELVFSADNVLTSQGTVTIPTTAVLNTPLRLRVSADYNLSAIPTPCSNPSYGQAEDYTVIIHSNTFAPVADFTASDTLTCTGIVDFTDISTNIPTSWSWNFGDGGVSNQQHPSHTYASSGTYTVTLVATNSHGNNTKIYTNLIRVNLSGFSKPASCSPATLSYCCGYGIFKVLFNNINNSSGNSSEGYQDFSCLHSTNVTEGSSYPIRINTGVNEPQDTRVWIDYNNNGSFSANELVFEGLNTYDPSGTIIIPNGTAVLNTPLRMRVGSDVVGSNLTPCTSPDKGQVEDYSIIIRVVGGINDLTDEKIISIYPNPASENITVTFDLPFNQFLDSPTRKNYIAIRDLLGKVVYRSEIPNQGSFSKSIDISEFSKGIYFISFVSKEKQITRKIIIQ